MRLNNITIRLICTIIIHSNRIIKIHVFYSCWQLDFSVAEMKVHHPRGQYFVGNEAPFLHIHPLSVRDSKVGKIHNLIPQLVEINTEKIGNRLRHKYG